MVEIEIVRSTDYAKMFSDLKEQVRRAQQKAMRSVNQELILLYHNIGAQILRLQLEKGWGSKIIDQLSKDLKSVFPEMKGFSSSNLKYMRRFAEEYTKEEISQQSVDQLPWSHVIRIITAIDSSEIRAFYVRKSIENAWSRETLNRNIENRLHEREGKAVSNFNDRLPSQLSDLAQQSFKDPYFWDFLSLHDNALEREIENSLIKHLEKFLIDLGAGFAFVGRQYKLVVSNTPYYLDLLFYNLKLHAYVVIELKDGAFKPEYAGKLNFYLSAVDDMLKSPIDNPSIGLILCKCKDNVTAEYALKDINKPIGLAEYKLERAIPADLKGALPSIDEIEAELNSAMFKEKEK